MLRPGLLYFAYGCNMDRATLAEVVGFEPAPGWVALVDGWRLTFDKGGEGPTGRSVAANLAAGEGCQTYGVVYRLPREALAPLDQFEGVPEHYRCEVLWAQPLGRRARQTVLTYVAQPRWVVAAGRPEDAYLDALLRGAAFHDLPRPYVEWLRNLARGGEVDCYRAGC